MKCSARLVSFILLVTISLKCAIAEEADQSACAKYVGAVKGDVIQRELIANWSEALPCLVGIVDSISADITSVKATETRRDLLHTTVAIRAILEDHKNEAVPQFRSKINQHKLSTISVFAYSARSDNHELRVNATPTLAYVIDNDTLCVPIDHLYDSKINPPGRVNLLAVVAAFTPKVNQQNMTNVKNLVAYTKSVGPGPQASNILDTVQERLNKLGPNPPTGSASDLAACAAYSPIWANGHLSYPNH